MLKWWEHTYVYTYVTCIVANITVTPRTYEEEEIHNALFESEGVLQLLVNITESEFSDLLDLHKA